MSPTTKSAARSGTAFMSDCISMTSTMQVSSTTNRSQSSGLSSPRLKPPPLGRPPAAGGSSWPPSRAPQSCAAWQALLSARTVGSSDALARRGYVQDGALMMVVLPTPGPPVITTDLGRQRKTDRRDLAFGQGPDRCASRPTARLCPDRIQGQGSVPFASRVSRSAMVRSRPMQTGPGTHTASHRPDRRSRCRPAARDQARYGSVAAAPRAASRPAGATVPSAGRSALFVHRLGQRTRKFPRAPGSSLSFIDAELHCNGVCGLEANACEYRAPGRYGLFGRRLDGVRTIGLEDPHRPRRADTVAMEEDHNFANCLLLGPGSENPRTAEPVRCRRLHAAGPVSSPR